MTSEGASPYEWTGLKDDEGGVIHFDGLDSTEELKDIVFSDTLEVQHIMILVNTYNTVPSAKVNWFTLEKQESITVYSMLNATAIANFMKFPKTALTPVHEHKLKFDLDGSIFGSRVAGTVSIHFVLFFFFWWGVK